MTHLTPEEFVDLLDGVLSPERTTHARECGSCREGAEQLAATVARARDDRVQEPSPLFWDHFAARIADAIRKEPPPTPRRWSWVPQPALAWGTSAAIAVLLMVTTLWRATLPPATPVATSHHGAPASVEQVVAPLDIEEEGAWAVVRVAAEDLPLEDVQAAGIAARPGTSDDVALELTGEELTELARLIANEMKNGAS